MSSMGEWYDYFVGDEYEDGFEEGGFYYFAEDNDNAFRDKIARAIKANRDIVYGITGKVFEFFEDTIPAIGMEARDGQLEMAEDILDALKDSRHVAVEAGVGIGKSYAYLVPALLFNRASRKPVIIATSTIALQEQLARDVRYLAACLGLSPEVIMAKGQSHYVCNMRANDGLCQVNKKIREECIKAYANGGQERRDFPENMSARDWERISIKRFRSRGTCDKCREHCQYYELRENMKRTEGIVICNQDLLTAHLCRQKDNISYGSGLINPAAALTIIDEAHNLESKVRNAVTERFVEMDLYALIRNALNDVNRYNRSGAEGKYHAAQRSIGHFFKLLQKEVDRQMNDSDDMRDASRFAFPEDKENKRIYCRALKKMTESLEDAIESIQLSSTYGFSVREHPTAALDDLLRKGEALRKLQVYLDHNILWIDKIKNTLEFCWCPKDTGEIIKNLYFGRGSTVVLTSATLTNMNAGSPSDQYAYFVANTGFPDDTGGTLANPKPSPFPYDRHAMIYHCDDLPHPTNDRKRFLEQGVERLMQLLDITQGKALVLFTAKSDMEAVYEHLCRQELPYHVLKQAQGSSQEEVLEEFKSNVNSVLLGTGAFWEGISIEGKALSQVVVFKLPFPVPEPVINYKQAVAKNGLMDVLVPEMVLKLKQGVGRLIRNYTDTGIISIIDPRLSDQHAKPYTQLVWDALPIKNRTTDIEVLQEFYEGLYTIA